jgi:hypothetical protein
MGNLQFSVDSRKGRLGVDRTTMIEGSFVKSMVNPFSAPREKGVKSRIFHNTMVLEFDRCLELRNLIHCGRSEESLNNN